MLLVTRIFLYLVSTAPFLVYNIRVTTHLVYTPYIACMCIACTLSRILLVYNSTSYWTKPSSSADLGSSFIHVFAALMLSAHVLSAGSNSNVTTFGWLARQLLASEAVAPGLVGMGTRVPTQNNKLYSRKSPALAHVCKDKG